MNKVSRSRLESKIDPNLILTGHLGEKFADYRRRWAEAEAGQRPPAPFTWI